MKIREKEVYVPTQLGLKHGIDDTGLSCLSGYFFTEEELKTLLQDAITFGTEIEAGVHERNYQFTSAEQFMRGLKN